MLTALRKGLDLVTETTGFGAGLSPNDKLAAIPREVPEVYDALCRADTVGVFQIESRAQMAMLPRLKPRRFYDLVVEVALVRPGPIQGGMVHPYLRRRSGEEPPEPPHPLLAPILERTLGVPLFQEQVMQLAIVGGVHRGNRRARRDMAAWRKNGNPRHREKLSRASGRGASRTFAERSRADPGLRQYGFGEPRGSFHAARLRERVAEVLPPPPSRRPSDSQPMVHSPATFERRAARRRPLTARRHERVGLRRRRALRHPPGPARARARQAAGRRVERARRSPSRASRISARASSRATRCSPSIRRSTRSPENAARRLDRRRPGGGLPVGRAR